jgi:hypothetical protein
MLQYYDALTTDLTIVLTLVQAGDSSSVLTERFVAHFYACVTDLARRSAALTNKPARRGRPRGAVVAGQAGGGMTGLIPASTPRRPSVTRTQSSSAHSSTGGGSTHSADHDKHASTGSSVSGSGGSGGELSRRLATTRDTANTEDGYTSSHSSRHDSRDFGLPDSEQEDAAPEGSGEPFQDATGKGLMLEIMGLRSFSGEDHAEAGDAFRDVESGEETVTSPAPRGKGLSLRPVDAADNAAHGHSGRQVLSKRERLEQFCATPMRDPVVLPAQGSSDGGSGKAQKSIGPAAVTKAWAAVGRIDGGTGQLLGQVSELMPSMFQHAQGALINGLR